MFKAVKPEVDIQKLEREQLDFWRLNRIFERSMEERKDAPRYVTYEGPPTVNGVPGVHHVLARAFKDIFPRYKTMRGYYALRKGGWDTHGLPVELALEKELGFTQKKQIEEYGIAVLKQFWDKNLLYKGLKVVPYCSRCGTPLSSHEVSLGYQDVEDPSVFVRFPLRDKPGVYFLVWTTTPWTLPANVALAVGENLDYVQVEGPVPNGEGTENLILAASLVDKVLTNREGYQIVKKFKGKDLLNTHYSPLYTFLPVETNYAYVVAGDFVSTEDGTGIVHIAPAFGVDDMAVGKENNLPVLQTVGADGKFIDAVTEFRGVWVKDADPEITRDLKRRGLMYKAERHKHTYPFCWRCGTPLLYFARDAWFLRATEYRQKMIDLNQTINWVPDHVQDGRFGNWLNELKDWALGRERYWGTPLPVWIDDQTGEGLCVGSVAELSQLAGRDLTELDLHRPYVDDITFPNPNGRGGTMRRVPEVIDVWFDSGAMPLAQWGYPAHNQEIFEEQFPADYICEAVDQTRGWFYTLHSISSMLFEEVSYKNVICLGLILDAKGEKMSKSKGNIVDPWEVFNAHGADAFRWYLFTSGPPGEPRRFSKDLVGDVVSRFWLTLWNTYSFFITYANLDGWTPTSAQPPVAQRDLLDQFVLAELHQMVKDVTEAFDTYDVPGATRPVEAFVEMLSNWYVRLSRRRFWKSESDADKMGAYATLYECLVTVSKLIAPTMPFMADALYRNLVVELDPKAPMSVHLALFPESNPALINETLVREMRLVEKLVSLGRAARESVRLGVRQPLADARFAVREARESGVIERFADLIMSELNVKSVGALNNAGDVVMYKLNPLQSLLGKKLRADFPKVQKWVRDDAPDADKRQWGEALLRGENIVVQLDGQDFALAAEEVQVTRGAAEGYAVAEDGGYLASLDTRLTEELIDEGLAREVVRRVQSLRKDADFNVEDRISLKYQAGERLTKAINRFADYIRAQTLAETMEQGDTNGDFVSAMYQPDPDGDPKKDTSIDGETLAIGVKRV